MAFDQIMIIINILVKRAMINRGPNKRNVALNDGKGILAAIIQLISFELLHYFKIKS